jgi:hypothetical protein
MAQAMLELATVLTAIWPHKAAIALKLIVQPLALILTNIWQQANPPRLLWLKQHTGCKDND